MIETPDYPHIVMTFMYRGFKVEIDQSEDNGQTVYAAWANHDRGCAIAVPCAYSRNEVVWKAKQWCDRNPR
ncbi:MAG TPA: hypothetical protein V6D29_01180 [Leptolyngbyaceae cyanobacterium]